MKGYFLSFAILCCASYMESWVLCFGFHCSITSMIRNCFLFWILLWCTIIHAFSHLSIIVYLNLDNFFCIQTVFFCWAYICTCLSWTKGVLSGSNGEQQRSVTNHKMSLWYKLHNFSWAQLPGTRLTHQ